MQALAFARRLRDQLESAHVTYQRHPLRIRASIGLASIGNDTVGSIEDLIKLATHRMQQAASRKEDRIVGQDDLAFVKPPSLPSDIERAVQTLEYLNAERLGDGSNEILRRLLPFIDSAVRRLHVDFPADELARALQDKKPG